MSRTQRTVRTVVDAVAVSGFVVLALLILRATEPAAPVTAPAPLPLPLLLVALAACAAVVLARLRVWLP